MTEYKTIAGECSGEITEKKSRFIATLCPVETEEAALEFIARMKKNYWDARHNCSAYIIGTDKPLERCNDDGEPSRSAGMPMLDILKGSDLHNVVVVVTRYFGGILLGVGGLVRAYQEAVRAGINNGTVITKRLVNEVRITTDYNGYGRLSYFAETGSLFIKSSDFTDTVNVVLLLDDTELGSLTKKMTEVTSGRCKIENLGKVWA